NEIALEILNMGKDGYKNDAEGFEKINKANALIEKHVKEQLLLHGVVKPLPSFLYEDDGKIYTGVRGDADITKNWEKYIGAKNTERLMYIDKHLK
ncbi:MAG: hypothetical protein GY739_17145, partial [Mesoflavibacter sp.]|nr:hypothetical protein [Mesoflavibacter sp.]